MRYERYLPATGAALLIIIGGSAPSVSAQGNNRFQAYDRNGDGVITRAEWRGTDRSFQNHDWNGDGRLSGEEVRPGGRRTTGLDDEGDVDRAMTGDYRMTTERFRALDHNSDARLTPTEWHADGVAFRRLDQDRDGALTLREFAGVEDFSMEDRFADLDYDHDGRVTPDEWFGTVAAYRQLDDNRDGVLSRAEVDGTPPADEWDRFANVDFNRDGWIARDEWHWGAPLFDRHDTNGDGRLTRQEFDTAPQPTPAPGIGYRTGYDRGLQEGSAAGREDRVRKQGWDLEGQQELVAADSGYTPQLGSRTDYQAGYREGFRRGYKEGFGPLDRFSLP